MDAYDVFSSNIVDFSREVHTDEKHADAVFEASSRKSLRRSVSMDNILTHVAIDLDEVYVLSIARQQTRADALTLRLRTRSISRDYLDKLAQPKRKHISHEDLQAKYVTMAEGVNQFHPKTPKRFHTKPKTDPSVMVKVCGPIPCTVPQSPALATKQRARLTHLLTREEQELLDYEELKKFKANPVNVKILQRPAQLPCVVKKSPTRLSPFKLTEVAVKKASVSPKSQSRAGKRFNLEPTIVKPFSFEQRDRHHLNKREKLLAEVLEEEQKKRIFLAKPVPKTIYKSPEAKSSNDILHGKHQKSDIPILNTIRRAKEREEFDQKRKENAEEIVQAIKEHSEQMLKHEEEEVAKLRKGMEHKAQPIRRYKEVQPVAAKKLTSPISPKFLSDNVRNKEKLNH